MNIIGLTGFTCSGKSSICKYCVDKLELNLLSFHDQVRKLAKIKGYKRTRYWLQDTGINSFRSESTEAVLKIFDSAKQSNINYIIDGIYTQNLTDSLISRNIRVITIAIISSKDTRKVRFQSRERLAASETDTEMDFIDGFKIEMGINSVIENANYKIHNEGDFNSTLDNVSNIISSFLTTK